MREQLANAFRAIENASCSDGADLMAGPRTIKKKASEEASVATLLSQNLYWECANAGIDPTGSAILRAMEEREIEGKIDAISRHLAAKQVFTTKGPKGTGLAAYAKLFRYENPRSILKPDHIRRRQTQLSRKSVALTSEVKAAKVATLEDAHAAIDDLWGSPHRSLAVYLLLHLQSD